MICSWYSVNIWWMNELRTWVITQCCQLMKFWLLFIYIFYYIYTNVFWSIVQRLFVREFPGTCENSALRTYSRNCKSYFLGVGMESCISNYLCTLKFDSLFQHPIACYYFWRFQFLAAFNMLLFKRKTGYFYLAI